MNRYALGKQETLARFCEEKDKQIEELKAHVERLSEPLQQAVEWCDDTTETVSLCLWDVRELLNETPAQSLNEIKAAAIDEAVKKYENKGACDGNYIYSDGLLDYAKQLRGEK